MTIGREGDAADVLASAGAPNCRRCLTAMEPAGPVARPYWWCASCGAARIA